MRFPIRSQLEHSHRPRAFADLTLLGILREHRHAGSESQDADDGRHGFAV